MHLRKTFTRQLVVGFSFRISPLIVWLKGQASCALVMVNLGGCSLRACVCAKPRLPACSVGTTVACTFYAAVKRAKRSHEFYVCKFIEMTFKLRCYRQVERWCMRRNNSVHIELDESRDILNAGSEPL